MQAFIQKFNTYFSLKDLGQLNHLLGIKVTRDEERSYLCQTKYIQKLIDKVHLNESKHV